MQIAFCLFKYFPHGGIQRKMMKMARECLQRGHRVRVYVLHWNAPELREDHFELIVVPVTAVTNHTRYARFAEWVRDHLKEKPVDLVVGLNKMPGLDVYYAGDSCYEEKARTQRNSFYRLLPRYKHLASAERAVFRADSHTEILTISDVQIPFFRKYYHTPPERFHPLPLGIDRDRAAPVNKLEIRTKLRREFEITEDELLLLFVGSGFIKKGLDRALLALHGLPRPLYRRTRLFVLGNDNAEPFRRMAKRLGVDALVRFFDGRDDVPRFLFSADGLLLPAYDENGGLVILEAMIAGLPALVTQNCGYAHYLKDAGAGLVAPEPFRQEEFNQLVVELLTSEERSCWSANGCAVAKQEEIYILAEKAVDYFELFAHAKRPVIAFALFKYFPYGGLQRDFMAIAKSCLNRGYGVRVYTLSWQGERPEGFEVVEVPVQALRNHQRYKRFAQWIAADIKWRPVVRLVGFNKMPGLDVYYAADSCYEEKAQHFRTPLYRKTQRYRFFSGFERAVFGPEENTQVLLITAHQQTQFQKFYDTPTERFHLLPPSVSPDRKKPADAPAVREAFRQEFGIGNDEFVLLLIGSGFITKGLDRALLAMAALPGEVRARTRLFAIGQDNPKQFRNLAEAKGIGKRVTILAGRDDVPSFLQGADLLIHPAHMESGGIVLLEAMIAGLPVIATDICGFAPYVEQAGGGVLVPSPFVQETLNDLLLMALMNGDKRKHWSTNGVRFGERSDIYDMPERACDLIEETLSG